MPLTADDWGQIAAWAEKRDQRLYGHLLLNRFLQGYVTAVLGSRPPYQIQLQRIGESTADGASYMSPNPAYLPRIGDLVECVWRDDKVAYVLWPINTGALTANRVLLTPPVVLTVPAAIVYFNNIPPAVQNLTLYGRVFGTDANPAAINWQANPDSGNHYSSELLQGVNSTANATPDRTNVSACHIGDANSSGYATGNTFVLTIPFANLVAGNHIFNSISSRFEFGATTVNVWSHWWAPTTASAVSGFNMWLAAGNINTGSSFTLYGDLY